MRYDSLVVNFSTIQKVHDFNIAIVNYVTFAQIKSSDLGHIFLVQLKIKNI
jgi:hypothetical protein